MIQLPQPIKVFFIKQTKQTINQTYTCIKMQVDWNKATDFDIEDHQRNKTKQINKPTNKQINKQTNDQPNVYLVQKRKLPGTRLHNLTLKTTKENKTKQTNNQQTNKQTNKQNDQQNVYLL